MGVKILKFSKFYQKVNYSIQCLIPYIKIFFLASQLIPVDEMIDAGIENKREKQENVTQDCTIIPDHKRRQCA